MIHSHVLNPVKRVIHQGNISFSKYVVQQRIIANHVSQANQHIGIGHHSFVKQIKSSNKTNLSAHHRFIFHQHIQVRTFMIDRYLHLRCMVDNTIVFTDSTPCVIVRTTTHQYSFCFRRQLCSQSQTSAFCTSRSNAHEICRREKDDSNLLTIENEDEYQLINDVISLYSNETLLDGDGLIKNQFIQRAQWMWIDGLRSSETFYGWNIHSDHLTEIHENYWCNNQSNCMGGKGRDHVVLNIVCQTNAKLTRVCLASRRQSEPGPFICKRTLKGNESKSILLSQANDDPSSL